MYNRYTYVDCLCFRANPKHRLKMDLRLCHTKQSGSIEKQWCETHAGTDFTIDANYSFKPLHDRAPNSAPSHRSHLPLLTLTHGAAPLGWWCSERNCATGELAFPAYLYRNGKYAMRWIIVRFYGVIPLVQSDDVFGPVEVSRYFFELN